MSSKLLIAVVGPTASGKTDLSIRLAQSFGADVFSADSRQFYKELSIGVARPSTQELSQARHHFIGHLSIQDAYSAGDFEKDGLEKLESYFSKNDTAVLVGGSGLFIKAILEGLDSFPEVPENLRTTLNERFQSEGIDSLVNELKSLDPVSIHTIDLTNPRRVIRALEVSLASGKPFSYFKGQSKKIRPFTAVKVALDWEREQLYERINTRTEQMFANGLIDEVQSVLAYRHLNALNTVGYSEVFDYLDGKYTKEEALAKVQQHTRNYAKRQLTWLRKQEDIVWVKSQQKLDEIVSQIRARFKS